MCVEVRKRTPLKLLLDQFDKREVEALSKLRSRLTYANAMSTIALFLAMGGGAYAVTVPKNSVGPKQLKSGAVSSAKVKNGSLLMSDFKSGQLALGAAARADDVDPPAKYGAIVASTSLRTRIKGRVFVIGALRDPFLTCGGGACSSQWGVYVDDKPVQNTGITLSAEPDASDGRVYHTLFGVTGTLKPGLHRIRIARTDSPNITAVGQLGTQLGALQLSG
jgi:hypothetical protein